ncbi:MAG: polyprenyl synthetase family protein [Actinomycetota bacterium]|nr:polyprenyl synthetase family protein [Actinomycetota bacterium]
MAVTASVESLVQAAGTHVSALMQALEHRLAELSAGHGEALARHGGDTIAAGGKRLRPLLVFIVAGDLPGAPVGLVRAAVAVELIHSATLVHDDVLDAAELRRGRPTVVATAGRGVATATGDLLFSRAFAELALNQRADEVQVLSDASSALVQGELLQRADAFQPAVTVERYLCRCELKTARLFEAACRLGALESPCEPQPPSDPLGRFGRAIGLAFQLLDDVLDVSGPPERTGKARGTDLLDGTVTLPLILARERDALLAGLDLHEVATPSDAEGVCQRIEASGALAAARQRALAIVADAKASLPELPERQRAALELVADGVVERYA